MYNNNANKRHLPSDYQSQPHKKPKVALYLDDHTPVRTIEVTNVDNVSASFLSGYFDHAGRVTSVSFYNKLQGDKLIRTALVTFALPEDAANLILDPNLSSNFKFAIKQAESIYQPEIDPNQFKFEWLNDDCLLNIASYLNFVDILNLGKSSTRLQSLTRLIFQKKTHFTFRMDTGDSCINRLNVNHFLQETGRYIESVEGELLDEVHLDLLVRNCPEITELKLQYPSHILHKHVVRKNIQFFSNLETLSLSDSSIFDGALNAIISSQSRLRSLQLKNCTNVAGKFLTTWRNSQLRVLKLIGCTKVDPVIVYIFVRNNHLVNFAYDGPFFHRYPLLPMECTEQFEELELKFTDISQADNFDFHNLPRLTHLSLTFNAVRNYNTTLATMSQITTLQSLTVQGINVDVDTLKCLGALQNLRELRLLKYSNQMGDHLYSSLHVYLPQITALSISQSEHYEVNVQSGYMTEKRIQSKLICDMIASLTALRFFSYDMITGMILDDILANQLKLKRQRLDVELPADFSSAGIQTRFAASGAVKISFLPYLPFRRRDNRYLHPNSYNYF